MLYIETANTMTIKDRSLPQHLIIPNLSEMGKITEMFACVQNWLLYNNQKDLFSFCACAHAHAHARAHSCVCACVCVCAC